jgi:hypothetical protein
MLQQQGNLSRGQFAARSASRGARRLAAAALQKAQHLFELAGPRQCPIRARSRARHPIELALPECLRRMKLPVVVLPLW